MLKGVTILMGPAGAGKTARLLAAYRKSLAEGPPGCALWLAPTHRAVAVARARLLEEGLAGCASPNCFTFEHFAARILSASALDVRPVSSPLARQILRGVIQQACGDGALRYFSPTAETPGFVDLVSSFVQELKRLEIWPEEWLAACGPRPSDKDRELHELYHRYQTVLLKNRLYDPPGRAWLARERLREADGPPFSNLRSVFVDGFSDFTRTEHEMLEILAARVESLTISLADEPGDERGDLFAKTRHTLAELTQRHPGLRRVELERGEIQNAFGHLELNLFANPRRVQIHEEPRGIEIVPAAGGIEEIETVARRVKRLMVEGDGEGQSVAPEDILVVFRSLGDVAALVDEMFARFEIPYFVSAERMLASAPVIQALRRWLAVAREDWPYRQLIELLGDSFFRPKWRECASDRARIAAESMVRYLQVASGRAALLEALGRLAQREGASSARPGHLSRPEQARLALPLLRKIAQGFDSLPQRATISNWRQALASFAKNLGLIGCDSPEEVGDQRVWQQFLFALSEREDLFAWLDAGSRELDAHEFAEVLDELVENEPLERDHDETGRVRIVAAESARALRARFVFVAGLSEQAFPATHTDDCLRSEAETRRLISAGLPLAAAADRRGYEMLLFYEVVTRTTQQLVLSYPALDQAAMPLSPSPYLLEIERLFSPGSLRSAAPTQPSALPGDDDLYCARDFRVRAVQSAIEGDAALLGGLYQNPQTQRATTNILAGLHVIASRRGRSFGPFEGMISSPAAREVLHDRYGPERCWSPSQLEQYARCPYQFLLERVLAIEPSDELELETNYLNRGRMIHWLLAELHRRNNESSGGPCSPAMASQQEFASIAESLLAELVDGSTGFHPVANGLLQIDAQRVAKWLADYYRQHQKYDERWQGLSEPLLPAHFEVSFGPVRHKRDADEPVEFQDPLSTVEPFELDCGPETIRFSGRIDRIDLGRSGEQIVFGIVDYKSGKPSARTSGKSVFDGNSLQLPLYALATEWLLSARAALPYQAAYWHIAADGIRSQDAISFHEELNGNLSASPEWRFLEKSLRRRVYSLVQGIRGGEFPMHSADDRCTSYCSYRTVCRVNQTRGLEKEWKPPELANQ
ncbi:MAG TPA: PD-(D/E)XK nuclease family protein [Pirellulales bacterium]|nr:PD-(D/E)XK nuclease family protein [Pirellulales bacterium]